jgi:hypothetical protein
MSNKRVVIGKFGTGSGEFGLRVSETGSDAINANGTAVSVDNLIFDSKNPSGSLALYKVYDIDVGAASGGNSDQGRTPTSVTQSFGETLAFTPFALVNLVVSSTLHYTEHFTRATLVQHIGGDSNGPDDDGFTYSTSTTGITINNYSDNSITVRAALFYAPV